MADLVTKPVVETVIRVTEKKYTNIATSMLGDVSPQAYINATTTVTVVVSLRVPPETWLPLNSLPGTLKRA